MPGAAAPGKYPVNNADFRQGVVVGKDTSIFGPLLDSEYRADLNIKTWDCM